MSALALMGLLPKDAEIASGSLCFQGEDLVTMKPEKRRQLCGSKMAMVFQEPMTALDPTMRVGRQVAEVSLLRRRQPRDDTRARVLGHLERVGFADPQRIADAYPHELSGGQRQRASLARALALKPKLLIADEPTSALDVSVQAKVLRLFKQLQVEIGFACLFITHDLAVVDMLADRIMVMHNGRIVEHGDARQIIHDPQDPYTKRLLDSLPVPDPREQKARRLARLERS